MPEQSRPEERLDRGMRTRREVLGDAHVDRAVAAATPFTQPFQDHIVGVAWADVWSRDGIDRRTRSVVTLSVLMALGHWDELRMHVRAARRNGLTEDEIAEVLLHATVYCGAPAGNKAFAVAAEALAEPED
jgi:4-carboxymuconolactone decarboxylase